MKATNYDAEDRESLEAAAKSESEILLDPSTSYWLKDQIVALRKRDPVDALRDIEVLAQLARERFEEN